MSNFRRRLDRNYTSTASPTADTCLHFTGLLQKLRIGAAVLVEIRCAGSRETSIIRVVILDLSTWQLNIYRSSVSGMSNYVYLINASYAQVNAFMQVGALNSFHPLFENIFLPKKLSRIIQSIPVNTMFSDAVITSIRLPSLGRLNELLSRLT